MPKFNPFRPNEIVHPAMFAGRYDECVALEKALFQTKHGNPAHFIIDGERGIGKSSLLFNLYWVANGRIKTFEESQSFNFVVVSISLDATHTYSDIVRSIGSEISRQIAEREQLKDLARSAWDFIKKWEVAGVRFREDQKEAPKDTELVEDLSFAIAESLRNLANEVDGILVLIDEADKPPASANLGALLKLLTERLNVRNCNRVCFGLAGLSSLREKLRKSHESSLRLFNVFALRPLSMEECVSVIRRGLDEAKAKNGFETRIEAEAEQMLSYITEGYPHFIQQFAYCAFESDTDRLIDADDVFKGAYDEDVGALRQLGLKYFEKQYFDQIGSDEYRQVLRVMAQQLDNWVTKGQIRMETSGIKNSTLDNALTALKARGIIAAKAGAKGVYRLPSRSFAVWIRAYTQAEQLRTAANIPGQRGLNAIIKDRPDTSRRNNTPSGADSN